MSAASFLKKLLPYTSAGLAIALVYVAWTFLSRWSDNSAADHATQAGRARKDAQIVEMYGSGKLTILNLYATPGLIARGQKGLLCYGVSNAKTVRIEPGVEPVKPSISRCIEIAPVKNTEYTLTAEDESGAKATRSVTVRVQ